MRPTSTACGHPWVCPAAPSRPTTPAAAWDTPVGLVTRHTLLCGPGGEIHTNPRHTQHPAGEGSSEGLGVEASEEGIFRTLTLPDLSSPHIFLVWSLQNPTPLDLFNPTLPSLPTTQRTTRTLALPLRKCSSPHQDSWLPLPSDLSKWFHLSVPLTGLILASSHPAPRQLLTSQLYLWCPWATSQGHGAKEGHKPHLPGFITGPFCLIKVFTPADILRFRSSGRRQTDRTAHPTQDLRHQDAVPAFLESKLTCQCVGGRVEGACWEGSGIS